MVLCRMAITVVVGTTTEIIHFHPQVWHKPTVLTLVQTGPILPCIKMYTWIAGFKLSLIHIVFSSNLTSLHFLIFHFIFFFIFNLEKHLRAT